MAGESPRAEDKPVARLVCYAGSVQGVGFRITAARIARQHPVRGYVKNLPDGRVELYAEGAPGAVAGFLEAVRAYWKSHIDQEQIQEQTPSGRYQGFDIVH